MLPRIIATAKPWNVSRAIEELGDIIYPLDMNVKIINDESKFTLIYIYSIVSYEVLFKHIVGNLPAYVERVVPVHTIVRGTYEEIASMIHSLLVKKDIKMFSLEVKPRSFYIMDDEKRAAKRLAEFLVLKGYMVSRKAACSVKVEDTRFGIVLAVMKRGSDRLAYWRRRRLGVTV